jgi:hypothetical protein
MTTIAPRDVRERDVEIHAEPVIQLRRRTIDSILIGVGAVATVAFLVAGALLMWGSGFAADYVGDELSSQNISFPPAAALEEDGRQDLLDHAGDAVDTGPEAEAYASYIDGHLQEVAGGATYADLGTPEREATAAVAAAEAEGADEATLAELEADATAISGQRNTLFKGETLRGLLLTAYAWSTVGRIAGLAAIAAFVAGGVMLVLVVLGLRHHHQVATQA